jgi:hypothetical protein
VAIIAPPLFMDAAVDLDDQVLSCAVEIDDIVADPRLPRELPTRKPSIAQRFPK